jgi:NitT/TauT family transport system permease protein
VCRHPLPRTLLPRVIRFLAPILLLGAIVTVWQLYITAHPEAIINLGTPRGVVAALVRDGRSGLLWKDFEYTFGETAAGFAVGVFGGVLLGVLLRSSLYLNVLTRPYIALMGIIPPFALAPLFVTWFGIDFGSKVVVAAYSSYAFAALAAARGMERAAAQYDDLNVVLRPKRRRFLLKILFPASVSEIVVTLRMSVAFCLSGVFIGEVISSEYGLAHYIYTEMGLFQMSAVYVGILGLALVALLCDLLARVVGAGLSYIASLV